LLDVSSQLSLPDDTPRFILILFDTLLFRRFHLFSRRHLARRLMLIFTSFRASVLFSPRFVT